MPVRAEKLASCCGGEAIKTHDRFSHCGQIFFRPRIERSIYDDGSLAAENCKVPRDQFRTLNMPLPWRRM